MVLKSKKNNYAFIDSQNVNLAIRDLGWKLNWKQFRVYLREKYGVSKAFMFIGFIEDNKDLYTSLRDAGFLCIFKPTLKYKDGSTKGNCDAEMVLQAMIEYPNFDQAVIATGDGDFHCLVKYLIDQHKLECLLVPNKVKFSALFKMRNIVPYLRYINDLRARLEYKKRPYEDGTS